MPQRLNKEQVSQAESEHQGTTNLHEWYRMSQTRRLLHPCRLFVLLVAEHRHNAAIPSLQASLCYSNLRSISCRKAIGTVSR